MKNSAFSLVELVVVLGILAMLVSLAVPEFGRMQDKARSAQCAGNLRQIGVAVSLYTGDNDATFPVIETNPSDPVYPPEVAAKPILETLGPYGVTEEVLKCRSDLARGNHFQTLGSSYEWRPLFDGESTVNPVIYTRRGAFQVRISRLRLCTDFDSLHNGRQNTLYADGRVKIY